MGETRTVMSGQFYLEKKSEWYTLDAYCTNCGWGGSVNITKGSFLNGHACPNCECAGLKAKPKVILKWIPHDCERK